MKFDGSLFFFDKKTNCVFPPVGAGVVPSHGDPVGGGAQDGKVSQATVAADGAAKEDGGYDGGYDGDFDGSDAGLHFRCCTVCCMYELMSHYGRFSD